MQISIPVLMRLQGQAQPLNMSGYFRNTSLSKCRRSSGNSPDLASWAPSWRPPSGPGTSSIFGSTSWCITPATATVAPSVSPTGTTFPSGSLECASLTCLRGKSSSWTPSSLCSCWLPHDSPQCKVLSTA